MSADHAAATVLVDAPQSISEALRSATRQEHEHAETRSYITRLMGGELSLAEYTRYLAQYAYVYEALESRDEPTDPAFLRDAALDRLDAIHADLAALGVSDLETEHPPLASTSAYVAHLREVAAGPLPEYVAHHYTRYLGDLSGGLAIGAMISRHYGASPEQLNFFQFDGIEKPVIYKREYRAALDGLEIDESEIERLLAEAKRAFELNAALFEELGATLA